MEMTIDTPMPLILLFIEGTVAIGDLIYLEILQGFKNDKDFKKAKSVIATLDQYEMFGHLMADKCAESYRSLRKKGITIRKTTDVIIANFCIENRIPLLFSDRDFKPFVEKLGMLAVVAET
ncbi:MAG: VapC toxin family PIN domain ribonuclease [Pseudomonadales bacterium]